MAHESQVKRTMSEATQRKPCSRCGINPRSGSTSSWCAACHLEKKKARLADPAVRRAYLDKLRDQRNLLDAADPDRVARRREMKRAQYEARMASKPRLPDKCKTCGSDDVRRYKDGKSFGYCHKCLAEKKRSDRDSSGCVVCGKPRFKKRSGKVATRCEDCYKEQRKSHGVASFRRDSLCPICGIRPRQYNRNWTIVTYCKECASCRAKTYNERTYKRRKYGITNDEYDALLAAQGGNCPVCNNPLLNDDLKAIDHDHSCCSGTKACGKCVRGILHRNCNSALGLLLDDPAVLRRAADYLERSANKRAAPSPEPLEMNPV